tara:strand:+ start:368 stop:1105 length:738 start_codon:yes stop_codon:yes gene_type:complete
MYYRILIIFICFFPAKLLADNKNFIEFREQKNFIKVMRIHNINNNIKFEVKKKNIYNWDLRILKKNRLEKDIKKILKLDNISLSNFEIINNNHRFQIRKDNLLDLLKIGFVTSIFNDKKINRNNVWLYNKKEIKKYDINFISKNYNSVIQNENIKKISLIDIFLSKKIYDGYTIDSYHKALIDTDINGLKNICDSCIIDNKLNNSKSVEIILIPRSFYLHFFFSLISAFIFFLLITYFIYEKFKK